MVGLGVIGGTMAILTLWDALRAATLKQAAPALPGMVCIVCLMIGEVVTARTELRQRRQNGPAGKTAGDEGDVPTGKPPLADETTPVAEL